MAILRNKKLQNIEKMYNLLFSMRKNSGLCTLFAVYYAIQLYEVKNNVLLLYKKIVKHNRYKALDSLSQILILICSKTKSY